MNLLKSNVCRMIEKKAEVVVGDDNNELLYSIALCLTPVVIRLGIK